MTQQNDAWFDQKLVNLLVWLNGAVGRYPVLAEEDKTSTQNKITDLLGDKDSRAIYCSPMTRYGIATSHPLVADGLRNIQKFYKVPADERKNEVAAAIEKGEKMLDTLSKALQYAKENQAELEQDLRTLGAYAEIFFGPFTKVKEVTAQSQ